MGKILFFFLSFYFIFNPRPILAANQNIEELAFCLREKKFIMYGSNHCAACAIQREYFRDSFKQILYINCDENKKLCQEKNINSYPTWEDRYGTKYKGAISPDILGQLSNCSVRIDKSQSKTSTINLNQIIAAFFAGLLSFLAPCLLPLFPAYFSVITGFTFTDLYGLDFSTIRPRVVISSLFFISGFSFVYTFLGATGSVVGQLIDNYLPISLKISGVVLIVLGFMQTGIIKIHALQFDFAWKVQKRLANLGFATAFITGVAAALSWIPCVSPLLAPILLLATVSETALLGAFYLFIYSLGLTLPFILGSIFFPNIVNILKDYRRLFHLLSVMAGIFLIMFGSILIIGYYRQFIDFFNNYLSLFLKR